MVTAITKPTSQIATIAQAFRTPRMSAITGAASETKAGFHTALPKDRYVDALHADNGAIPISSNRAANSGPAALS